MNNEKEQVSVDRTAETLPEDKTVEEKKPSEDGQISVIYNLVRLLIIIAISFVIVFTISYAIMPFLRLPDEGGSFARTTREWNSRTFEIDADGVKGTAFVAETGEGNAYLITCYHVIESDTLGVKVKIGGAYQEAEFVGKDEYCDIAVVKIEFEGRNYTLSQASAGIGDGVRILGNSGGKGVKAAEGIVSDMCYADLSTDPKGIFYEVTAHIAEGMSGGPVFTEDGAILGVAARRTSSENVNFVTPYAIVRSAYERIVRHSTEKPVAYTVGYDDGTESETVSFVNSSISYDGAAVRLEDGRKIEAVGGKSVSTLVDIIAACTDYDNSTERLEGGETYKTVTLTLSGDVTHVMRVA